MLFLARWLWLLTGSLFVVLGVVGAFLPLLPTTPFMLLAAYCFAKSSPRAHTWLLNNPWFGQQIRDYYAGKGIPVRTKLIAVAMVTISMVYVLATADALVVKLVMFAVWVAVSGYLMLGIPSRQSDRGESSVSDSAQ